MRNAAILVVLALGACGPTDGFHNEQVYYGPAVAPAAPSPVLGAALIQAGAGMIAPNPPPAPMAPFSCYQQPLGRGQSLTCW